MVAQQLRHPRTARRTARGRPRSPGTGDAPLRHPDQPHDGADGRRRAVGRRNGGAARRASTPTTYCTPSTSCASPTCTWRPAPVPAARPSAASTSTDLSSLRRITYSGTPARPGPRAAGRPASSVTSSSRCTAPRRPAASAASTRWTTASRNCSARSAGPFPGCASRSGHPAPDRARTRASAARSGSTHRRSRRVTWTTRN